MSTFGILMLLGAVAMATAGGYLTHHFYIHRGWKKDVGLYVSVGAWVLVFPVAWGEIDEVAVLIPIAMISAMLACVLGVLGFMLRGFCAQLGLHKTIF